MFYLVKRDFSSGIGTVTPPAATGTGAGRWRAPSRTPPRWCTRRTSATRPSPPPSASPTRRATGRRRYTRVAPTSITRSVSSSQRASEYPQTFCVVDAVRSLLKSFICTTAELYKMVFHFLHSYQNGPDTYLLQLRDVDFPVRLREYLKVAANRGPGYSRVVADQSHLDWRVSVECT